MTSPSATMTVVPAASDAFVIVIAGEVTSTCEPELMAAHEQATDAGAKLVVLDFSGMEYMNSGGIGMLVTLLVRGQRRQQRIAAVGLSEHYRQIFQLTRLDEAIALHDDVPDALAAD
jgi:anti-sigma B factor antagonist